MIKQLNYQDAGVNIDAGDALVDRIKPMAAKTFRPEVLSSIGGFGGLFKLKNYEQPVLVSGTDGVGTKLKLAFELNRHDTIGQDLVAMSVNDILVQGAEPLFFLDYFACGKLNVDTAADVVKGIANGCTLSNCSLIGGETAEMPSMYPAGEYDLAGFAVGVVEEKNIITGEHIKHGDVVLGLASSGAHSNGYSLIRKVLDVAKVDINTPIETLNIDGKSLADAIMAPTKIYVKSILNVLQNPETKNHIKGMAHITGGGLLENIPRVLPKGLSAILSEKSWQMPALFSWLQTQGNIDIQEMYRVFNCGIGMVIVCAPEHAKELHAILSTNGETVYELGHIQTSTTDMPRTLVV